MMKNNERLPIGKIIWNTLKYSWKASPAVFLALIAASWLFCAIQVLEVYATRSFFDKIALFAEGESAFTDVIFAGLPVAIILLLGPVVEIVEYLAQGYFWRRGSGYLLSLFHLRTGQLRLIDFETANTFDDMKKARFASEGAPAAGRSVIQVAFYYLPYFLFTSVFLYTIKPVLVFAILCIFGSVLISQFVRAATVYQFENQNAGLRRQTEYYESCITAKEYFKETRTLGVFAYFYDRFVRATERFGKSFMQMEKKIAFVEAVLRFVNALGYAGILGLLLYYVLDGTVSVGAFAAVFYSVDRINGILKRMVEDIGETAENMSTSSFLFSFLQAPKDGFREEHLDKYSDIHVRNVSFSYPGGESVLRDLSISIRKGETLAIVGENGAGKTTLTKLIAGLYQPTEGSVLYGEQDCSEYKPQQRFHSISGVFQSFIRYRMTLRENIQISEWASGSSTDDVIRKAGVQMEWFSQGLDTMLSREFGGTELSGGQWQRVAIAQGFYRIHDVIILDEPTAAIDPIEETNIFRLFQESARGKTAILVTHRLGSAKIADRIIVMEGGEIVEQGNHAELMALGGKYASMFTEQPNGMNGNEGLRVTTKSTGFRSLCF